MPNIFGALNELYEVLPYGDTVLRNDVIDALLEFERHLEGVGRNDRLLSVAQLSFQQSLDRKFTQRIDHFGNGHDLIVVGNRVRDLAEEYARLVRQTFAGTQHR